MGSQVMINVFTPGEKARLDAASINATGRYLLCCICSSGDPVTYDDLAEYTGYEKERLRKAVKRLEDIGVVTITHRHKQAALIKASFV